MAITFQIQGQERSEGRLGMSPVGDQPIFRQRIRIFGEAIE